MKKLLKLNVSHSYLPLAIVFLGLIYISKDNPKIQLQVVIAAAISYVAIALLHHHIDKSLTFEIIIEYILIAVLALIILQGQLVF